jgi:hypothetical protein
MIRAMLLALAFTTIYGCATKVCDSSSSCYRLAEELGKERKYELAKQNLIKGCDIYKHADSCVELSRSPFFGLSAAEKETYLERSCEFGVNIDCENLWRPEIVHIGDGDIPKRDRSRIMLDRLCKGGKAAACVELAVLSQFFDPQPFQSYDSMLSDICKKRIRSDEALRYRACAMHGFTNMRSADKKVSETALLTLKLNCMSATSTEVFPICVLINKQKAIGILQAAACSSPGCAEYNHALGACGLLKKPDIVQAIDKHFDNTTNASRAINIVLDIRKHCGVADVDIPL